MKKKQKIDSCESSKEGFTSLVSLSDRDGIITYVNDPYLAVTGYEREELIGCHHRIFNSGHHTSDFFKEMWETLLTKKAWNGEVCNRTKDGHIVWLKTTITPLLNNEGEIGQFLEVREDITECKKNEFMKEDKEDTVSFILEGSDSGMFQYFPQTKHLEYDNKFLNILGIKSSTIGNTLEGLFQFIHEEDIAQLKDRIQRHFKGSSDSFDQLVRFKTEDTMTKSILIRGKVLRWNGPSPIYVVGTVVDFTEQLGLENLLLQTQKVARIGSWERVIGEEEFRWSPTLFEIFGYTPYSFRPNRERFYTHLPEIYHNELLENLKHVIDTGESLSFEMPIVDNHGKEVWLHHIFHGEMFNGKVVKVYGTAQDISQQKKLQFDLELSRKKFDMALETAGFGIGEIDFASLETKMDDYLLNLLEVPTHKKNFTFYDFKNSILTEDFEKMMDAYIKSVRKEESVVYADFRVVTKSGGLRYLQTRGIINYSDEGIPVSMLGLFWDNTKHKEFENILIETKNKAESATKMKSEFLASMSHEIRTPMNGVLGMLELLKDTELSAEQKNIIDTISVCSDNLLTTVNDVLDFSKIEAGKMTLEYRIFDLHKMLINVAEFFRLSAKSKGIDIRLNIDESTPHFIEIDEVRLKQVINNLFSNAIKFTSDGFVELTVYSNQPNFSGSASSSTHGIIQFIVKDTGIGIDEKGLSKLFNSFSQVDNSTARKFGGTGLGLAISKSIVENMNGNIRVRSKPGEGSTFKFSISCDFYQNYELKLDQSQENSGFRNDIDILVAEDNKINQTLIRALFGKIGCSIDIAEHGAEAIEMSSLKKYDIVFMDLQMPVLDGIAAARTLMTFDRHERPIIVAMTANVFHEDRQRCYNVGMSDFVAKPISKKALINTLVKFFPSDEPILGKEDNMENQSESKYKLINPSQILFEFEEDFDIFEELFEDYQERSSAMIEEMKSAVIEKSAEKLKVSAHTMKGVVANFYCQQLTEAAFELEKAGRQGDLSNIDHLMTIFENFNGQVIAELASFIEDQKKKLVEAA